MSKPNTIIIEDNSKSIALQKMRIHCQEILEKYRKDRYNSKKEKNTKPINEPLDNYPELKKFIEENDKYNDISHKLMFESGCGKLERALFKAIANQNVEFVENLIELGVNVNIKTKLLKPIKAVIPAVSAGASNAFNGSDLFQSPPPQNDDESNDVIYTTPLYSALLSGSDLLFSGAEAIKLLSPLAVKKITYIILNLIQAGAVIDSPDLLGLLPKDTFLHRLILMTVKNPNLLATLNVILLGKPNLNHINSNDETPLYRLVTYMVEKENIDKPTIDLIKNIIQSLLKNGPHNYAQITRADTKLFDVLIQFKNSIKQQKQNKKIGRNKKECQDEVMKEYLVIIESIFEDMRFQAIEYFSQIKNREYRDAIETITQYCTKEFHNPNYDETIKISEEQVEAETALHENLHVPISSSFEAYYIIGLSFVKGDFNCFTVKDILEIIKSYCGHLTFINYVCTLGLHISFSDTTNWRETLSNNQVLPFPIEPVIATIEAQSLYLYSSTEPKKNLILLREKSPAEEITGLKNENSSLTNKNSALKIDLKTQQDNVYTYRFPNYKKPPFHYGMCADQMTIRPSRQKGSTVISFFDNGKPELSGAFLFLYRNKKDSNAKTQLCIGYQRDLDFADSFDNPAIKEFELKPFTVVTKK